jgi:hypothetical protein
MEWLLLVTLLAGGQQRPYKFQIQFTSKNECETAKAQVEKAYSATFATLDFHHSAVCIERSGAH